jgi:large subunit ribosomal protein L24
MAKIKKNDSVIVISGNHKGQTGKVTEIDRVNNRVIINGVNIRKKHLKPSATRQQGGVVEEEQSIHLSNVALVRPGKQARGSRIGYAIKKDGSKVRVLRQAKNKEVA